MKTLIIIGVILAVLSLYFVVNADKSITIKGSEVLPVGTDIAKFILNKARDLGSQIKIGNVPGFSDGKIGDASYSKTTNTVKTGAEAIKSKVSNLIPKVIDKARELVKGSIENKLIETFCPVK
ncbi:MAG: hypothetical protein Q7K16_02890 [Candidatus Azambacteria bacterium]|nr:hypothetical protein [Candidatus Azambacteria bacterium]